MSTTEIVGSAGGARAFVFVVCLWTLVLSSVAWWAAPTEHFVLDASSIELERGKVFRHRIAYENIGPYRIVPDSPGDLQHSKLTLLRDGVPLGPAHSNHGLLHAEGGGRYSHWRNLVYFSTPDGADPRTDGHRYTAVAPTEPRFLVRLAFGLSTIGVAAVLLLLFRPRGQWIFFGSLALITAYLNYVALYQGPLPLCLAPDSTGYLLSSAHRTIGYPIVLYLVRLVCDELSCLPVLQLNALLLAAAFMATSFARLTNRWFVCLAIYLAVVSCVDIVSFAALALTEVTFVCMLSLHLGACARFLRQPGSVSGSLIGVLGAFAILVRPAGYFLLVAIPFLVLLTWYSGVRLTRRNVFSIMAGLAAPLLLASVAHYAKTSDFGTQSFAGISLLGQVVPLLKTDAQHADPFVRELQASVNSALADQPTNVFSNEYRDHTTNSYNALLYTVALKKVRESLPRDATLTEQSVNDKARSAAMAIIRDEPLQYFAHVTSHTFGMWRALFSAPYPLASVRHDCANRTGAGLPSELGSIARYLNHQSIELNRWLQKSEGDVPATIFDKGRVLLSFFAPYFIVAGFALTFVWIVLLFRRNWSTPTSTLGIYAIACLWGYFVLVAMLQPALRRYAIIGDLFYWVSVGFAVCFVLNMWKARRQRSTPPTACAG